MPEISSFYGITVYMYFTDIMKHHRPHVHVKYSGYKAIFGIEDGNLIKGKLPISQRKLVEAWIEIHKKELTDNWQISISGRNPHKIEPLR